MTILLLLLLLLLLYFICILIALYTSSFLYCVWSYFFIISSWLLCDNIIFFRKNNAIDTNYNAVFFLFSPHISRIPFRGWDRKTNNFASFSHLKTIQRISTFNFICTIQMNKCYKYSMPSQR